MYIPKYYLEENQEEIISFMNAFNFATIVTVRDTLPVATHLPFTVTADGNQIILTSHFARANDQWRQLLANQVLVIFAEPHAYISPSHYEKEMNVPTWNYISVHAYGHAALIEETEQAFRSLEQMIQNFEPAYQNQWDHLPDEFKMKMLKGIVPFKITITDLQAKKKLSQNKTVNEQQKIIATLSVSAKPAERTIADYMKRNLEKGNIEST